MPEPSDETGDAVFSFTRQSRTPTALAAAASWAALLALLTLRFQAAWWVTAILALPLLMLLWDLWKNPEAGLTLGPRSIAWRSRTLQGEARLADIEKIRFDTRWDFSVRVTLLMRDGKRHRLPQESLPPHRDLEALLTKRGLQVERHHFTVF